MPTFYLHIHNGTNDIDDGEGSELADVHDARRLAILGIRSIVAEEAKAGRIDLRGRVDIADAGGATVMTVAFRDAFELELPQGGGDRAGET